MSVASKVKAAGRSVAVIEADLWGGTCPNRGCDPKKVMISAVEARDRVGQLQGKGFNEIPAIDWPQLEAFKRTFTDPVSEGRKRGLATEGIETVTGTAQFLDEHRLQVGERELFGETIVIATGQRPRLPEIPGQEFLATSTDFLSLPELPAEITFLGAGYIAFELATIAASCGGKVTLIQHNHRALKEFNQTLVPELIKQMEARGIEFIWNQTIDTVLDLGGKYQLVGPDFERITDLVVCATGRMPNVAELALEKAGVSYSQKGIAVNQYLQTNVPHIFACGDVVAKNHPKLTPVSVFEGEYLADAILGRWVSINYPMIPTIVYGSPKLAKVGLTDIAADHPEYTIKELNLTSWYTYHRVNEPIAKARLVFDKGGRIVGATTLSGQADELINLLGICIQQRLDHKAIKGMIMGYPTVASDLEYLV